jgi:hypothetical protein
LTDQIAAALEGFFWPKVFWDFLTKTLDGAVKPIPILQVINLLFGIAGLAFEWPLKFVAGSSLHRSIEFRLILLPLMSLAGILMYQSTNAALYYLIAEGVYFWAYSDGEVGHSVLVPNSLTNSSRLSATNLGLYLEFLQRRSVLHKFLGRSTSCYNIKSISEALHTFN